LPKVFHRSSLPDDLLRQQDHRIEGRWNSRDAGRER
jgi:hypothetical protein